jgi:hypothetical protein
MAVHRLAQPLVGRHDLVDHFQIAAGSTMTQRGQIGAIVVEARRQTHDVVPARRHRWPARIRASLQRHGGLPVPFGNLRQTLAPDRLAWQFAHGRLRHVLRLIELAAARNTR